MKKVIALALVLVGVIACAPTKGGSYPTTQINGGPDSRTSWVALSCTPQLSLDKSRYACNEEKVFSYSDLGYPAPIRLYSPLGLTNYFSEPEGLRLTNSSCELYGDRSTPVLLERTEFMPWGEETRVHFTSVRLELTINEPISDNGAVPELVGCTRRVITP